MRNKVDNANVRLCMLCGIPGIGLEKAKRLSDNIDILLLNRNGNICKVKDIAKIPGFGESTARKVLQVHLLLRKQKQEIRLEIAKDLTEENFNKLKCAFHTKIA